MHKKYQYNTFSFSATSMCLQSTIQLEQEGEPLPIKRRVRQGDTISPKLFISCLHQAFNKLNDKWNPKGYGIKIGNETINNLRFADDIILVGKTPKDLQQMLEDLHAMSERIGLKLNNSKTKIMFNTKTTPNHKIQS